ncbi:MAG: ORF6N domain-containing protein, partial [Nanoarchaeota archaeon]
MKGNRIIVTEEIENKIFTIRGVQVMIDRDLAELYQVETRVLNQAVKRNIERFPKEFMFQLTKAEYENLISQTAISNHILKSQSVISNEHGGRRKLPYAFTEQGVSMLSAVLRSNIAIQVSIQIINAFVSMRKIISSNKIVFDRLDRIELKQLKFESNFEEIFQLLENKDTN